MENEKGGIRISGVQGDVSGIVVGGTGNIAGKYVVKVSEQDLARIQNNEYAQSLRASLRMSINSRRPSVPKSIKSINQSMSEAC